MTATWFPARVNAAHDVSPMGGVMWTPADVTARSERGALTLNTPAFSSSFPLAPVSCSMRAWSSAALGAASAVVEVRNALSTPQRTRIRIGHLPLVGPGPQAAGMDQ